MIHGRMLLSWSSRVTTTSSPCRHDLASVRETSKLGCVALRPKTIPDGSAASRSAIARRASQTVRSARCSAAVTKPRLAIAAVSVSCHRCPDHVGDLGAAGPSKCAAPSASAGREADPLDVERHQSVRLSMRSPNQS